MPLRNVLLGLATAVVFGACPAAFAADLPPDVRTAGNAESLRGAIDEYVKKQVARLNDPDPKVSSAARDELWRQTEPTPVVQPSASFQLIYVNSVLNSIAPVLKDADVAKRLNGAIIISKLAISTRSNSLQATVTQLLNDPSPAIALWSIKAAGAILPTVLNLQMGAANQQLTRGIVTAAGRHTAGPIIVESYRALDQSQVQPPLPPASLNIGTLAMLDVLDSRIKQYVTGVPADPHVDREPMLYLGRSQVYQAAAPNDRLRIVQTMFNMMSASGERAAEMPRGELRDRMFDVTENAAGALQVQMNLSGNTAAAAAFNPLVRARSMAPNAIAPAVATALKTVQNAAAFKSLATPPAVEPVSEAAAK
ncbi:MAG TPA: hypothetical protein VGB55_09820 [Tepidisphaeraceae bacterium]